MFFVYLLQSIAEPSQRYVGFTTDVEQRLKTHNAGGSPHTSKHRPWRVVCFLAFQDHPAALAFEKYLKSGSGRAFAAKHLWNEGESRESRPAESPVAGRIG